MPRKKAKVKKVASRKDPENMGIPYEVIFKGSKKTSLPRGWHYAPMKRQSKAQLDKERVAGRMRWVEDMGVKLKKPKRLSRANVPIPKISPTTKLALHKSHQVRANTAAKARHHRMG